MSLAQSSTYQGEYDMDKEGTYSVFLLDNPSPAAEIFGVMLKDYMELNSQKQASHGMKVYDEHSQSSTSASSSQALTVYSSVSNKLNYQPTTNLKKLIVTQIFNHGKRDITILMDYIQQSSVAIILLSRDIVKSHLFIIELFHAIANRKPVSYTHLRAHET